MFVSFTNECLLTVLPAAPESNHKRNAYQRYVAFHGCLAILATNIITSNLTSRQEIDVRGTRHRCMRLRESSQHTGATQFGTQWVSLAVPGFVVRSVKEQDMRGMQYKFVIELESFSVEPISE